MTSGFGVDPTKDGSGNIISGTSSQDIRQIFGGLFSPGVVSGGTVTTSASSMTYTVAAGAGVISSASGQNIPIPIPAQTITATSVPSSGARTDIIYAQQRFPSIEGDSEVVINYGPTLPQRAIALKTYTQPAGATNTNAGSVSGDIDYAIPFGSSQGVLYTFKDSLNGNMPSSDIRMGVGNIYLPTDRYLRFAISCCASAANATGFDNAHYCEVHFYPELDLSGFAYWNTGGLHQAYAIRTFEYYMTVPAGTHTVSYIRGLATGPGTAQLHNGVNGAGMPFPGTTFTVTDAGVAR